MTDPGDTARLIGGERWSCASCGERHQGLALAFAAPAPVAWDALAPAERAESSELTEELCVIKNEHFFIRGLIELPILDTDLVFGWDVWSSLSRDNFQRALEVWNLRERADEPPYFGWLSNDLAMAYPPTLNLKVAVHTNEVGIRPTFELEPTDHPLAIEQRRGITAARVRELNMLLLHGGSIDARWGSEKMDEPD